MIRMLPEPEPPSTPVDPPGDAAADPLPSVGEIYDQHVSRVWRTLRALGVDEARVEDAVQDVFVTVHRKLPTFERRSSISTWVYGITRKVAAAHRRGARPDPDTGVLERLPDLGASPREHVEQRESARVLLSLLDELDDDGREVVVLMELEQLAAPAVAELLGIPLNTVYSRLRIARRRLESIAKRRLAKEEP